MGMGWSLAGLSTISRCPTTLADDGFIDGVDFDDNDLFCLDGQRLEAVNGVYGADETEYRTQNETFTKVKSYDQAGSGPMSFITWTKSGLIYDYAMTGDARVQAQGKSSVLYWKVNKIRDKKGNYINITYHENNATGESYPIRIDYTGNSAAGLNPYNSIQFIYDDRPDTIRSFLSGSLLQVNKRLQKIQMFADSNLVREYLFAYEESSLNGRSRLVRVTEEGSDGETLMPTEFVWGDNEAGIHSFSDVISTGNLHFTNGSMRVHLGDFNGDGRMDVLRSYDNPIYNHLWYGNKDGFDSAGPVLSTALLQHSNRTMRLHLGDFNGDGRTDLIRTHNNPIYNGMWYGTDNGFSAYQSILSSALLTHSNHTMQLHLGDFNGDGRTDLFRTHNNPIYNGMWYGTENGFSAYQSVLSTAPISHSNGTVRPHFGDFNGDGRMDVIRTMDNYQYDHLSFGSDNGFTPVGTVLTDELLQHSNGTVRVHVGDFNGDGLSDIFRTNNTATSNNVFFSKGDGTFEKAPNVLGQYEHNNGSARILPGDFNGDGLSDVFRMHENPSANVNAIYYADGKGGFAAGNSMDETFTHSNESIVSYPGDFNGDGKLDILRADNDPSGNHLFYGYGVENDFADQVIGITDGKGQNLEITYESISSDDSYSKDNDATYPARDVQGPMVVVSAYESDNGLGETSKISYKYAA